MPDNGQALRVQKQRLYLSHSTIRLCLPASRRGRPQSFAPAKARVVREMSSGKSSSPIEASDGTTYRRLERYRERRDPTRARVRRGGGDNRRGRRDRGREPKPVKRFGSSVMMLTPFGGTGNRCHGGRNLQANRFCRSLRRRAIALLLH